MTIHSPGARLRLAYCAGPIAIPGVFCPFVAKLAERIGFSAAYLSGGALSASLGLPDIGLVTLTEFVEQARSIIQATGLPLISDADTGFGESLNVERTVQLFEAAGVAGLHFEDQQLPKRCGHLSGKELVEADVMVSKIRAAVNARKNAEFVIIARTDARGVSGFAAAVQRALLYVEAGADVVFPEALESEEEFRQFAKEVPVPLLANMTEFGRSPSLDIHELGAMGYRLILFPLTAFRSAMKAAEDTLRSLKEQGHQRERLGTMMTRAELYEHLGYTGYETRDQAYFGR